MLLWRLLGSSSISTPTSTTSATPPSPTPSLQFAPTQVTRPSARITYKSGSTQDITVQDEPQTLWHADVEGLEIPLGATVTLLGDEGEDRKVEELQAGDVCTGDVCEGVKRAKMKQDFRVGLRQLRDAGSSVTPPFDLGADLPLEQSPTRLSPLSCRPLIHGLERTTSPSSPNSPSPVCLDSSGLSLPGEVPCPSPST